eukprot:364003-Chlamydomonas_euryale.AAC.19
MPWFHSAGMRRTQHSKETDQRSTAVRLPAGYCHGACKCCLHHARQQAVRPFTADDERQDATAGLALSTRGRAPIKDGLRIA